ncbi:signal peptidase I [Candidatus Poribacteria bacterium]|nr:signal peptidase I [Candidatus Poribacteria bacterium]
MAKNKQSTREKSFRDSTIWEYIKTFAFAFVLVFGFMRPFVVEGFSIPSSSMENTLLIGDRIFVSKFAYGIKIPGTKHRILAFQEPEVGDIFVFDPPPAAGKTQKFVKRLVGVEGDTIEIRNGELYRNGKRVTDEDYIKRINRSPLRYQNFGPVTVPEDHVFAMGDNRDLSSDSRAWGFVPVEDIAGRAFIRYWSWDKNANWFHKIRFSRIGRPLS